METVKDKEERDMLLKSVRKFLTAEGRYRRGQFGILGNWVGKTDAREQRSIALVDLKATVRKITRRKKR